MDGSKWEIGKSIKRKEKKLDVYLSVLFLVKE